MDGVLRPDLLADFHSVIFDRHLCERLLLPAVKIPKRQKQPVTLRIVAAFSFSWWLRLAGSLGRGDPSKHRRRGRAPKNSASFGEHHEQPLLIFLTRLLRQPEVVSGR